MKDIYSWTALSLAPHNGLHFSHQLTCQYLNFNVAGHLKVVRALLKAEADVNVKDSDGWTALMFATTNGRHFT